MNDILQVQGINSKGFGVIPKLVMQDKRLTSEAKAIYSYFCSYAGAGRTAFPSRAKIISDLCMSCKRYYKHFELLKRFGYIKAEQEKKQGRFQRNIYTLLENVPCSQNECTQIAHTQNECMQNDHTNNNSTNNNSIKNKQCFNNSLVSQSEKNDEQDEDRIAEQIKNYTELIKDNIDYTNLKNCRPHDINLIDEIVDVMIDALVSDSKHVRVDSENKPRELVKCVLLKLGYEHIELVIDQFKAFTGRINKKRQFILTMLYNSKMELDLHYTNLVRSDMYD